MKDETYVRKIIAHTHSTAMRLIRLQQRIEDRPAGAGMQALLAAMKRMHERAVRQEFPSRQDVMGDLPEAAWPEVGILRTVPHEIFALVAVLSTGKKPTDFYGVGVEPRPRNFRPVCLRTRTGLS